MAVELNPVPWQSAAAELYPGKIFEHPTDFYYRMSREIHVEAGGYAALPLGHHEREEAEKTAYREFSVATFSDFGRGERTFMETMQQVIRNQREEMGNG